MNTKCKSNLWAKVISALFIAFFAIGACSFSSNNTNAKTNDNNIDLVIFYGNGCPHCAKALSLLEEMKLKYNNLNVIEYQVYGDRENSILFQKMADIYDSKIGGVPTIFIDDKVIVGYGPKISKSIEETISYCEEKGCVSPLKKLKNSNNGDIIEIIGDSSPAKDPKQEELTKKLTIPAVIGASAIDAINPCAFAVLIILITTVLATKNRKRALFSGLAFTSSIFISYLLMGIGLYSAIQAAEITRIFYFIVAILAIIVGLFNLKDYLWYGKWFVMEVPMSWRPKLKALIRGVTSIPGAFLIGFAVSLFLLPCTSGPYIVILGLLAHATQWSYALSLLILYNFVFILPMLLITGAIYFQFTTTEKAEEWRQSKLKVLHLVAGIIILLLGIGMLVSIALGYM